MARYIRWCSLLVIWFGSNSTIFFVEYNVETWGWKTPYPKNIRFLDKFSID